MAALSRNGCVKEYLRFVRQQPVKEKTVFYHAFRTKIMSCSPFAIFQEIISRPDFADFEHIWVYGSKSVLAYDTFQRYMNLPNVRYVLTNTVEHMEALATSEYLITNAALPDYWQKREGQVSINTWHGTPLKTLGKDAHDFNGRSIANAQRNFILADYLVMPCEYTTEKLLDAYFVKNLTKARVLEYGYPRTDLVLKSDTNHTLALLEKALGKSLVGKKIVLYAPTFRSVGGASIDNSRELARYMRRIYEGLPAQYELFFKVHNTMGDFFADDKEIGRRLLFDEIETNELLAVVDILITDYSSIFFDYICTEKPILFFNYDKDYYIHEHGIYLDYADLPGVECATHEEVLLQIEKVQDGTYVYPNKEKSINRFAPHDNGTASQRVVDAIFNSEFQQDYVVDNQEDGLKNVLISLDDHATMSSAFVLFDLLRNLDPLKHRVFISAYKVDLILKECLRIFPSAEILFSKIEYKNAWGFAKKNAAFYQAQFEKYFPPIEFESYYNLKQEKSFLDEMLYSLFPDMERYWAFAWDNSLSTSAIKKQAPGYTKVTVYCGTSDKVAENLSSSNISFITRNQMLVDSSRTMTVLFITAYDSTNYPMAICAKELESRGYFPVVISQKPKDLTNNAPFREAGIQVMPPSYFDEAALMFVDFVVGSPIKLKIFDALYDAIRANNIITCAFAGLFSSIAMRIYPDFVFSLGAAKDEEFRDNNLQYNCIAAGNPQYDPLVGKKKTNEKAKIESVLVVEQGGYPYGPKGKQQLADMLVAIAKANPHMTFTVKPRYLPDLRERTTHNVSEHVYDFFSECPKNLVLLRNQTVLEDIIANYDAMITLWSTAYLDAVVLNMPLILAEGFHSVDVFDVRTQRVNDAYKHLKGTGCVYHYSQLGNLSGLFRTAEKNYVDYEVFKNGTEAAPRIVSFLEFCYDHLVKANKRIGDNISCTIDSFYTQFPDYSLVDDSSESHRVRMCYLDAVNKELQEFVYQNRCMGNVLDLSCFSRYYSPDWDKFVAGAEKCETLIASVSRQMQSEFLHIRSDFFASDEGLAKVAEDPILQGYYFSWLYDSNIEPSSDNIPFPVKNTEIQDYYLARFYLDRHQYRKAYSSLFEFLHAGQNQDIVRYVEYRRMATSVDYFRSSLFQKLLFFQTLFTKENDDLIEYVYTSPVEKSLVAALMVARRSNREGDYEQACATCHTARNTTMHYKKPRRRQLVRRAGRKAFGVLIARQEEKAKKAISKKGKAL